MAKILVTGSKGSLGQPLTRELKWRGHEVWQVDLQHQRDDNYIRADASSCRQLERVFEQHYNEGLFPAYSSEVMSNIVPMKLYEYTAMEEPVICSDLLGMVKESGQDNGVVHTWIDLRTAKATEIYRKADVAKARHRVK